MMSEQELRLIREREYAEADNSPKEYDIADEIDLMRTEDLGKPVDAIALERKLCELDGLALGDQANFFAQYRENGFSNAGLSQLKGLGNAYLKRLHDLAAIKAELDLVQDGNLDEFGFAEKNPNILQIVQIYKGISDKLTSLIRAKEAER